MLHGTGLQGIKSNRSFELRNLFHSWKILLSALADENIFKLATSTMMIISIIYLSYILAIFTNDTIMMLLRRWNNYLSLITKLFIPLFGF